MNNTVHKAIKTGAIIFAVFLICFVIFGIAKFAAGAGNLIFDVNNSKDDSVTDYNTIYDKTLTETTINIQIKSAEMSIKSGDKFSVSTNNKNIKVSADNGQIMITDTSNSVNNDLYKLDVVIPTSYIFDSVNIESGAGKIKAETINSKDIDFELGAGSFEINKLIANNSASIDVAAGKMIINSGEISNLDLEMGTGNVIITSKLLNTCDFDSGVGELKLNVVGEEKDYLFDINKGIGTVKINNKTVNGDDVIGNGNNKIVVDSGVGSVNIDFAEIS